MRSLSRIFLTLLCPYCLLAGNTGYTVLGLEAGAWPPILSSIGLLPSKDGYVTVARPGTPASLEWQRKVEEGAILILEGESPLAASCGFVPGPKGISVSSMIDIHRQKLPLILSKPLQTKQFKIIKDVTIFTKDRWSDTPMVAGVRRGKGAILWVAADPGIQGYERFPYLPQALTDLGFIPPFRAQRIWAFFDYSYRTRVDLDYFARKWRAAGISALHVAAWHFYEADPDRDGYLQHLISACHREGITVYAWIELPHVSEKFWADHPQWREKTAVLQDAALDWRKLMNLANPDCFRAASAGITNLLHRFDWDGANLGELYFESLEGASNPAHFTPMNDDVRREFQKGYGFDPLEIWSTRKDAKSLRKFLDYRTSLAREMQEKWLTEVEKCRSFRPDLDIVLTHVDDRLDTDMKDAIGADSSHAFSLLKKHNFTFLVEDPATVWDLGPSRYPTIANRYPASPRLAIDINVVERYQDVYPTKQQTGLELYELLHVASIAFPRVALYFENSIAGTDMGFLSAASAVVTRYEQLGQQLSVDSPHGFSLPWVGAANVDGKPWAARNGSRLLVPAGQHVVEHASHGGPSLINFNGDLHSATGSNLQLDIAYASTSRALAEVDCHPLQLMIDGVLTAINQIGNTLILPSGERRATVFCK